VSTIRISFVDIIVDTASESGEPIIRRGPERTTEAPKFTPCEEPSGGVNIPTSCAIPVVIPAESVTASGAVIEGRKLILFESRIRRYIRTASATGQPRIIMIASSE